MRQALKPVFNLDDSFQDMQARLLENGLAERDARHCLTMPRPYLDNRSLADGDPDAAVRVCTFEHIKGRPDLIGLHKK